MKTKPLFLCSCFALLSFAFAGTALAGDTKIEQALRDLDIQWSAAAEAKDLDKTVSYYAEGAIVMPPNALSAITKDEIQTAWKNSWKSWCCHQLEDDQGGSSAIRRPWLHERDLQIHRERCERKASRRPRQIRRGLEKAGRRIMEVRDGYLEFRSSGCDRREKVSASRTGVLKLNCRKSRDLTPLNSPRLTASKCGLIL